MDISKNLSNNGACLEGEYTSKWESMNRTCCDFFSSETCNCIDDYNLRCERLFDNHIGAFMNEDSIFGYISELILCDLDLSSFTKSMHVLCNWHKMFINGVLRFRSKLSLSSSSSVYSIPISSKDYICLLIQSLVRLVQKHTEDSQSVSKVALRNVLLLLSREVKDALYDTLLTDMDMHYCKLIFGDGPVEKEPLFPLFIPHMTYYSLLEEFYRYLNRTRNQYRVTNAVEHRYSESNSCELFSLVVSALLYNTVPMYTISSAGEGCCDPSVSVRTLLSSLFRLNPSPMLPKYTGDYDAFVGCRLLDAIPSVLYNTLCDMILLTHWGNKSFLQDGNYEKQQYYTSLLLKALDSMSTEDLTRTDIDHDLALACSGSEHRGGGCGGLVRGIPLCILFSQSIANYLDVSDKKTRLLGMRVAKKFSSLMGQVLEFDEVVAADHAELKMKQDAATVSATLQSPVPPLKREPTPIVGEDFKKQLGLICFEDACDSDSDSDSDLEPFWDCSSDRSAGVNAGADQEHIQCQERSKPYITPYLRKCLELLKVSESAPETHDKHHAALMSIPTIVANRPVDINDLCVPITHQLLRLANDFNMENFNELRNAALHSLIFCYPELTLPAISSVVYCDSKTPSSLTLSSKINILYLVTRGAYSLAGLSHVFDPEYVATHINTLQGSDIENSWSKHALVGRTIVKRPKKLSLMKGDVDDSVSTSAVDVVAVTGKKEKQHQTCVNPVRPNLKVTYFKNKFASVFELFLQPVMMLLGEAERNCEVEFRRMEREHDVNSLNTPISPTAASSTVGNSLSVSSLGKCLITEISSMDMELDGKSNDAYGADCSIDPSPAFRNCAPSCPTERAVYSPHLYESIYTIIPSHCFVALAAFVHCSVNSTLQKSLVGQIIELSKLYWNAKALSLRRASMMATHASIESWKYMKVYGHRSRGSGVGVRGLRSRGALGKLTDVMHLSEVIGTDVSGQVADEDIDAMQVAEWCADACGANANSLFRGNTTIEPDETCRLLKSDIVSSVHSIMTSNRQLV